LDGRDLSGAQGRDASLRTRRSVAAKHLAAVWRQPDEGIWEVRGGPQHFVHSKVMAWVAFDRAALQTQAPESARRWRTVADEIQAEVCERGFDPDINSFVQAYGSKRVDASLLLIPLVGFLPASDPRIQGTLQAIEKRLLIDGEFVLRYETEKSGDGLPAGEGAFLACSFGLVDNYTLQGRYADARRLFDRLLSRCNDVGLLAEEFDPLTGRMLGNFPQAYSHVGLINCALNLSRQTGRAEERAETQAPPISVAPAGARGRIRGLVKKTPSRKGGLEINEAITEVLNLDFGLSDRYDCSC
jgi:GH15 family glucan-1,4-alpha-glucosidase